MNVTPQVSNMIENLLEKTQARLATTTTEEIERAISKRTESIERNEIILKARSIEVLLKQELIKWRKNHG